MSQERHPPGLAVLFFTEMWERFGFYTMGAMFVLYLRHPSEGFGWSAAEAADLNSWYLMAVYASPLAGGWIADRGLGYRNAVLLGGVIFMIGYLLFAFHSILMVYAALAMLVIGNGFFKPNVSAMVGHLYPEGSPLKDRAFNIFYMGINIGAFFAPLVAEYVSGKYGFRPAFMVAAGGMVVSVATLAAFRKYVLGAGAPLPSPPPVEEEGTSAITAQPPSAIMADPPTGPAGITPEAAPPTPPPPRPVNLIDTVPDRTRIGALIVIFLIVIVFWMVFHQNTSTLVFWANDNTDWTWLNQVSGREVSGILANAINPFFVVFFTFPLVWCWKKLNDIGLEPSTPSKIGIGMLLTAASFYLLWWGAKTGEGQEIRPEMYASADFRVTDLALKNLESAGVPGDVLQALQSKDKVGKYIIKDRKYSPDEKGTGEQKLQEALRTAIGAGNADRYGPQIIRQAYIFKVSPWWLILAYAIVTLGELMLSPMGLSLVSKVAPIHMRGLMMGGWFVATAIGNKLTAIGVYWDRWLHSSFFALLGTMALVVGIILFGLLRPLKKAMPGV